MNYKQFEKLDNKRKFKYLYLGNVILFLIIVMAFLTMAMLESSWGFGLGFITALFLVVVVVYYIIVMKQDEISNNKEVRK